MRLQPREKRILIGGLAVAVAIFAFNFGPKLVGQWRQIRASLDALQVKMKDMPDEKQRVALAALVPVFEVPQPEEKQKFAFRDRLNEQFKKAGINTEPLTFVPSRKKVGAYRPLFIKCKAKCKFDQLLDLLASLKDNQYLMGVEELRVQCDTKQPPEKRQEIEFDIVVSTLVQDTTVKPAPKEQS
jgi:hypothetical protein